MLPECVIRECVAVAPMVGVTDVAIDLAKERDVGADHAHETERRIIAERRTQIARSALLEVGANDRHVHHRAAAAVDDQRNSRAAGAMTISVSAATTPSLTVASAASSPRDPSPV